MDQYTLDTQKWLDDRFRQVTEEGIYFAHQPIYGFGDLNSEPYVINRYMITYHIMKALSSIEFKSLLDIGGAEGYKAAMVRELFGAEVQSCDLSQEAVNRAKEIFNVDGNAVDIHNLPYESDQFDIVLCSETLEHVKDYKAATLELLRVAKKAVLLRFHLSQ
jgi:ubiquinone/menaquinone biosynthesis C-methylase UbiE